MITETEMTIEQSIKKEIAKFDPFEARLLELKEQYSGLTIAGVEDKEGYIAVREAIAELRGIRTGTTKDKAVIKKPFLDACSTIEEKSKWIIAEVSKIEDPLQAQKDAIDAEKEKIKAQKKAAQEAVFIKRSMQLSNMGAIFDGTNFILEDASYEGVLVREADDDVYEEFILPKFKAVFDKRELVRLAEEAVKAEQAAAQQKLLDDIARQQKEIKDAQDKLDADRLAAEKERQEAEAKEQARISAEKKEEERKRTALQSQRLNELLPYNKYGVGVDMATLWTLDEDVYSKILANMKAEFEKQQAIDKEKAEFEKEKQIAIAAAAAAIKERERIEVEQKAAEAKRIADELKAAEELAKAGDKANWEAYIVKIKAITQPPFRSGQYRRIAQQAQVAIDGILNLKA